MNQILENKKNRLSKKKLYIIQFNIIIAIFFSLIMLYSYKMYFKNSISKISNVANKSYSITRLYSNNTNIDITTNNIQTSIIGTIKIPKINISYPIFSHYSDDLLKISVCKFYGPNINSSGNFCIIGHNYNNGDFFSNLYLLNKNDIINIYDLNSNVISYSIYDIYEINADNLDYLFQDTNRKKRTNFNYL